jgi:molecular chaperone GrpE
MSDEAKPPAPEKPDPTDQSDPTDPSDQVAKLEAELAKANEQNLRARAEFANYQKRAERDRALAAQAIKRDFVKALLPALDALNLAIQHSEKKGSDPLAVKGSDPFSSLLDGVKAARDAFEKALQAQGAVRIPATGTWDPDLHHPQAVVENAAVPNGTILEEVRPGYKVGNLVARHSEVLVSKRPAEKAREEKPEAPKAETKNEEEEATRG